MFIVFKMTAQIKHKPNQKRKKLKKIKGGREIMENTSKIRPIEHMFAYYKTCATNVIKQVGQI